MSLIGTVNKDSSWTCPYSTILWQIGLFKTGISHREACTSVEQESRISKQGSTNGKREEAHPSLPAELLSTNWYYLWTLHDALLILTSSSTGFRNCLYICTRSRYDTEYSDMEHSTSLQDSSDTTESYKLKNTKVVELCAQNQDTVTDASFETISSEQIVIAL